MSDRDRIAALLAAYALAVDAKDWIALAECFVPEVQCEYANAGRYEGFEAFLDMARPALERCAATQHLVGTVQIRFGEDGASGTSYAQAVHVLHTGEILSTGVRYDDTFVERDGGWRIASRRMCRIWGRGPNQVDC